MPELRPWLAWAVNADLKTTQDFADGAGGRWSKTSWTFTIFVDDEVAGGIGIEGYEPTLGSAQIGYWLRSDLVGRGLMTEAAGLIVDFAFRQLGIHRLELHAAPGNLGSVRVARKLGFSERGVLRDGGRGERGWHDVLVFDLLEGDERPRPQ